MKKLPYPSRVRVRTRGQAMVEFALILPVLPPLVSIGTPEQLLRRRPDIRATTSSRFWRIQGTSSPALPRATCST